MTELTTLSAQPDLDALAPAWLDLWRRADRPMPFQSPDWLLPWWHQFGTTRPVVATLRDAGRLVGLLPTYVLEEGGERKLLPWGVGLSDYFDVLLAAGAPPRAVDQLLAAVLAAVPDVAVFDCPDMPPDAALLGASAPPGWLAETHVGSPCPVLALAGAGPDLAGVVPSAMRRKLRMNGNRAEQLGGFWLEFGTTDTLDHDLATLTRMHQARWHAQGEPGVFADPRVGRFLDEATRRLLGSGLLRLAKALVGGRVAAIVLTLTWSPDRIAFYLSGFEADLADVSPGTLLYGTLIQFAERDGATEVHFLRGNEGYKHAWGATDRANTMRRFRRDS